MNRGQLRAYFVIFVLIALVVLVIALISGRGLTSGSDSVRALVTCEESAIGQMLERQEAVCFQSERCALTRKVGDDCPPGYNPAAEEGWCRLDRLSTEWKLHLGSASIYGCPEETSHCCTYVMREGVIRAAQETIEQRDVCNPESEGRCANRPEGYRYFASSGHQTGDFDLFPELGDIEYICQITRRNNFCQPRDCDARDVTCP